MSKSVTGTTSGVTRRDFVGGTLLGAGVSLLAMAAPGLTRSAAAQVFNMPLTGLGPEWTGPGGIGDYAGKNGNTAEVVNHAHALIRNSDREQEISSAKLVDDQYDLVVIGAGISGLTSAYIYKRDNPAARVLVIEQHAIFGGEAKQNEFEVDGYHLTGPQGSTGIVVPFGKAETVGFGAALKEDLGFNNDFTFQEAQNTSQAITVPADAWGPMHISWELGDTAFYYEGHGMVKNPWRNGFREAPISERLKKALVDLELFRTPPVRDDWQQWLDTMTYRQFLVDIVGTPEDLVDDVLEILNPVMASMGCGLGGNVISAYSAFNYLMPGVNGYYRYMFGGQDPTDIVYLATFPGGNTVIAQRLLKMVNPDALTGEVALDKVYASQVNWDQLDRPDKDVRLRLSSTVVRVAHEGTPGEAETVRVTYSQDGQLNAVRARSVICAGQQHANKHICADISEEYREAMGAFQHAPMLVVNVALRNWRFLDKMGVACVRWFDGLGWWASLRRNLVLDGVETQPLDPNKPVVLTLYIPFLQNPAVEFPMVCTMGRMQLFGMSYAQIEGQIREQFTKMFGPHGFNADNDIAGIVTNRQGHAYFVGPPGFYFGKDGQKAPKDVLREPFHRIAFGHSELSGAQMWETAAYEGERAAKQALAMTMPSS